MARKQRLFVAGMPYHVVQRGNNKEPIFLSAEDYEFFMEILYEAKEKHPCHIYSYCLMTNHFHLLIAPKEKSNVSLLMKLLGAKYVRYFNRVYERTGTLWESRFKCSLIQSELYFVSCLRYIEMNPVRAGIVKAPEFYQWSSHRFRAFGEKNPVLDMDPWYISLGDSAQQWQLEYRKLFRDPLSETTLKLIRDMTLKNGVVGDEGFKEEIERITGEKIVFRDQGRPRKSEK